MGIGVVCVVICDVRWGRFAPEGVFFLRSGSVCFTLTTFFSETPNDLGLFILRRPSADFPKPPASVSGLSRAHKEDARSQALSFLEVGGIALSVLGRYCRPRPRRRQEGGRIWGGGGGGQGGGGGGEGGGEGGADGGSGDGLGRKLNSVSTAPTEMAAATHSGSRSASKAEDAVANRGVSKRTVKSDGSAFAAPAGSAGSAPAAAAATSTAAASVAQGGTSTASAIP